MDKHEDIEVEAAEEIRAAGSNRLIALKGRRGIVDRWYIDQYGVGREAPDYQSFPVKFTGNKVHRDVPNYKLKVV